MAGLRRISYLWKEPDAAGNYSDRVSLHSHHTNQSRKRSISWPTWENQ